jgi:hypothetical protein
MFEDLRGTLAYHHSFLDFYRYIKKNCPETIFHATDVGHQYKNTGKWYREMLEAEGKQDTEEYRLVIENIEQGRAHKELKQGAIDHIRERCMWENFIREYEAIGCQPIMGIYGSYHTKPGGTIPCGDPRMATAITNRYGDAVEIISLTEQFNYRGREYGKILLVGEKHDEKDLIEEELKMWQKFYHEDAMRDLFIELPYYTGCLLNRWMKADNDDYLNILMENMKDKPAGSDAYRYFYNEIKRTCPDTVFHATDVGHQFDTTGKYYLELLEKEGKKDTREYDLTAEAIDQGKRLRANGSCDHAYREACMGLNFVRAYEYIGCKPIMGIYGGFHTKIDGVLENGEPRMAKALHKRFGDKVETKNLFVE